MSAPLPGWTRWLALAAGAMDTATGVGLVLLPVWTLQRMGIAPPGPEALGFVRFVGVFVGAVGLSYLVAWGRGHDRALRTVFDITRLFRTGAGVFTGVMVFAAVWLGVAFASRYSSLAALVATAATPLVFAAFGSGPVAILFAVLAAIAWYKHGANIGRLRAGTESRIGSG